MQNSTQNFLSIYLFLSRQDINGHAHKHMCAQTWVITQKLYALQHCLANSSDIFLGSYYIFY